MLGHFRTALELLTRPERRSLKLVLALSALAAIVQTIAIVSIMPFIVLLSSPGTLETNQRIAAIYEWLGASSYSSFLLALGAIGVAALAIGNIVVAVEHWFSSRFLFLLANRIQQLLLDRMLAQPYEYFVRHNSARLSDIVLKQVERAVDGVIGASIIVISNAALAVFIVAMLLVVSFATTLLTLAGLLTLYAGLFLLLRRRVAKHGYELTRLSGDVFTAVRETLDGVREIRTRGAERFFAQRLAEPNHRIARIAVRYSVLTFLPHFMLETLVVAGLVSVALFLVATTQSGSAALSLIALYGLSIYRLTPSLKSMFEGMARVHHNADAIRLVREHCAAPRAHEAASQPVPPPRRRLRIERVSYRYAGSTGPQVDSIDLEIPTGSSLCLFGPSGSGKTTLLNLIAGLIFAQRGRILCDDVEIGPPTVDAWRGNIGYCGQEVFLFDATIASNIAFGVPAAAIDHARVREVARLANLGDFVGEHPDRGYDTVVGEDGKTLSGGQRQRLGIARALYHDPAVLILDESFTGLDAANKRAILDNLFALAGKTLIFSSHDPVIAARCAAVAVLEAGAIVAYGSYDEVAGDPAPEMSRMGA